jgi:hypothetical protein
MLEETGAEFIDENKDAPVVRLPAALFHPTAAVSRVAPWGRGGFH